jgi:hypothetical protein
MAGEWIPIDCNLGTKPEVLELVDVTGEPVEAVVYRLIQLWSWASMNTADGSIRCTPARLRAVAGGDETFWLAVEQVGWVSFDGGHMTITGWDKRFSKSAKARLHDNRRKSLEREKNCDVRVLSEKCPEKTGPEERREEERKEELNLLRRFRRASRKSGHARRRPLRSFGIWIPAGKESPTRIAANGVTRIPLRTSAKSWRRPPPGSRQTRREPNGKTGGSFSSRGLAVAKTAAAVAVSVVTVLTRSRRLSVGSTSISRPITAVPAKLPPWPLH